jgi:pimeloyl-ACP methyl ester carboxylesterase
MINYKIYKNEASNSWVTFVHGFGGNMSFWSKQIDEFQKHFNLLLIDLRGHGDSKNLSQKEDYSLELAADDILHLLDYLKIRKTSFVGLSFGTIIINVFAAKNPSRVNKIVFTGAILRLNAYLMLLLNLGRFFTYFLSYNELIKVFSKTIMHTKTQGDLLLLVKREGKGLGQEEFDKWKACLPTLKQKLSELNEAKFEIEKLYLMGENDRMFLPHVKNSIEKKAFENLIIVEHCGHIVNLEKPEVFNNEAIKFLLDT